jgi:hypothetical protein
MLINNGNKIRGAATLTGESTHTVCPAIPSCALAACRQGKRVRFFGVASLVNDLLAANHELRLSKLTAQITKLDLVVLDELGFVPFTKDGAQLLFQLCSDRNEQVPIIVTTNLRFADWNAIFGDEIMTTAFLDRITHKAHILEVVGESYRYRHRLQQGKAEGARETKQYCQEYELQWTQEGCRLPESGVLLHEWFTRRSADYLSMVAACAKTRYPAAAANPRDAVLSANAL